MAEVSKAQVAADLTAALALVDAPEKWAHRRIPLLGDCRCAGIAICSAVYRARSGRNHEQRLQAAYDAFGASAGLDALATIVSIGKWNDAPERTHAEVVAAFRAAIATAGGMP